MNACKSCGARITDLHERCPYCDASTPFASSRREEETEEAAERAADVHEFAKDSLGRTSKHALIWAIAGFVTCCSPLSIVGLVLGIRARRLATAHSLVLPVTATLSLVLSTMGLLMFLTLALWFALDSRRIEARRVELKSLIHERGGAPALDHDTACALVELHLITAGYNKKGKYSIKEFECAGTVDNRGNRAILDDVFFKTGSKERHTVRACLRKGAVWFLDDLTPPRQPCTTTSSSTATPPL